MQVISQIFFGKKYVRSHKGKVPSTIVGDQGGLSREDMK